MTWLPSSRLPASPPPSSMAAVFRKPQADLYTVLLLVAWLALVIGVIVLYLETAEYGSPPWG